MIRELKYDAMAGLPMLLLFLVAFELVALTWLPKL